MRGWEAVSIALALAACGDNSSGVITLENPSPHLMDFYGERIVPLGTTFLLASPSATVDAFDDAGLVELRDSRTGTLIERFGDEGPSTARRYGDWIAVIGHRFALGNWSAGTVSFFDTETGKLVDEYQGGPDTTVEVSTAGSWFVLLSRHADDTTTVRLVAEDGTRSAPLTSGAAGDQFGRDVIATTNRIVICAPYARVDDLPRAGAAYIFDQAGALQQTLTATVPTADSYFADHLVSLGDRFALEDLSGETAIYDEAGQRVGAVPAVGTMTALGTDLVIARPYDAAGEAFVVDGATATIRAHLPNPRADGQLFGAVSPTSNGAFVITSWLETVDGMEESGSAYLYDPATMQLQELVPPSRGVHYDFGSSVTANGDVIAISEPGFEGTGRVLLYSSHGGDLIGEVDNPEPDKDDGFGYLALASPADRLIVSATGDHVGDADLAGTVYMFPPLTEWR